MKAILSWLLDNLEVLCFTKPCSVEYTIFFIPYLISIFKQWLQGLESANFPVFFEKRPTYRVYFFIFL